MDFYSKLSGKKILDTILTMEQLMKQHSALLGDDMRVGPGALQIDEEQDRLLEE